MECELNTKLEKSGYTPDEIILLNIQSEFRFLKDDYGYNSYKISALAYEIQVILSSNKHKSTIHFLWLMSGELEVYMKKSGFFSTKIIYITKKLNPAQSSVKVNYSNIKEILKIYVPLIKKEINK